MNDGPVAARRHRPGRAGAHRRGQRGRAGRGGHRADRGAEPGAERRRHADLRPGARGGARRRRRARSPGCRTCSRTWPARWRACASPRVRAFLAGNVSTFDSELVVRLRQAGLVILGKTNTPEFGMAPACEPVLFGPTRNPWDTSAPPAGPAAARRRRWRRAWCRSPTATTWAARCATRRRRAGCSPSSRPGPATRSGPSTATSPRGGAVEHALTRSVRDSAALLDATSGPRPATRTGRRRPRARSRTRSGADPGRLRIALHRPDPRRRPRPPRLRRRRRARRAAVRVARPRGHREPTGRASRPRSARPSARCSTPPPRGSCATGSAASAASRAPTRSSR